MSWPAVASRVPTAVSALKTSAPRSAVAASRWLERTPTTTERTPAFSSRKYRWRRLGRRGHGGSARAGATGRPRARWSPADLQVPHQLGGRTAAGLGGEQAGHTRRARHAVSRRAAVSWPRTRSSRRGRRARRPAARPSVGGERAVGGGEACARSRAVATRPAVARDLAADRRGGWPSRAGDPGVVQALLQPCGALPPVGSGQPAVLGIRALPFSIRSLASRSVCEPVCQPLQRTALGVH